ncbi:TraX family protein, partial [Paenibacillus humicus]|uniref:TraX family protein n=1 Tax=Paenibacillus humicus TaxID=412861 RepID=UPI003D2ABBCF
MIKIIAMLTMLIDHVGVVFFPNQIIFTIIGRLAFPLFCYGIANGFITTGNFNNYLLRLSMLAVISQIPYYFLFKNHYLNVCFTLAFGLLIIKLGLSRI